MDNEQLARLYGGQQNAVQYFQHDGRTDREKLTQKLESNSAQILRLQEQNKEIDEAIDLLNQHPIQEKLTNLIKKLIG